MPNWKHFCMCMTNMTNDSIKVKRRKKSIGFDWRLCRTFPIKSVWISQKASKHRKKLLEARRRNENTPIIDQKCVLLKLCPYTWKNSECKEIWCNHFRSQGINMTECFEFFNVRRKIIEYRQSVRFHRTPGMMSSKTFSRNANNEKQ